MATQIDTSTAADATGAANQALIQLAPSDSSVIVIYFGNNGPMLATAQSPYTTFATQGIGSNTTRNSQAFVVKSDDSLDVMVQSPGNNAYFFRATRSGNSWSLTAEGTIIAYNAAGATADSAFGIDDPKGRVWLGGLDDVAVPYTGYAAYTANDALPFTASANTPINLGEQNHAGLAAALIGNYLVVVYDSGSGGLTYTRLDVSQSALGAWSTPTAIAGISDATTASTLALAAIPGGSTGMLVYRGSASIKALLYNAGTDTWGAATTLSSAANDRHPSLVAGASGIIYALWCQYAAANSYALVGAAYSAGAWSGSVTTLEASGNNIAWPHAAYISASTKLALLWTQGAASPYGVEFDSVSAPATGGGGSPNHLAGTLAATVAIAGVLTVTKALRATLAAAVTLAGALSVGSQAPTGTVTLSDSVAATVTLSDSVGEVN